MDILCPYCGKEQDIEHDGGYGYEENEVHKQQCGECDKYFTYTTSISFYYDAEKADCLNGDEHNFFPTKTYPKQYSLMRCEDCGEERIPTTEEMTKILNNE